ncbi:PREDICTED: putative disease resistance protein RGA3 [Erythranthe guttata]|uniref:putative disease resistance protein RGA3 n=1 Tax=Erythranthe guttata TaxID=4155 RepID=UPI00064DBADB|nr:PREDICTED: putative disease resistance protein RGA3 [Erythranthe guttata]|eukprot:XP_012829384.1 PREDICTED: putative disease resistance protein RGA3 [Erythranthe guttata]
MPRFALAANVVGRLLRGKPIDEWLSTDEKWLSDLKDENLVIKILKLSFDHLSPPSLKKCFAYCSIFLKGYDLERERLVELWMQKDSLEEMMIWRLLATNSLINF